jgi:hypothetical protein
LAALALAGVVGYLVLKRGDEVKEMNVAGYGIVFRDPSPGSARAPSEERAQALKVVQEVREDLQQQSSTAVITNVDLTGTWTVPGTDASWTVTSENGFFVFREHSLEAPDLVEAMGYGPFDGQSWAVRFRTIAETEGHGTLELVDERTLAGEVSVGDERFTVELKR